MEKYRYSGKIRPGEALIKTLVYPASSMFCLSYAMVCKFKTPTNSGCLVVMWPADARAFSRPTSKAGEKRPGDEVEEPYRWGGTYLYSLYKGVPPPPSGVHGFTVSVTISQGGCLLSQFHFTLCRYFLGHVACRNLPWHGLFFHCCQSLLSVIAVSHCCPPHSFQYSLT